jgi:hypothetical protein
MSAGEGLVTSNAGMAARSGLQFGHLQVQLQEGQAIGKLLGLLGCRCLRRLAGSDLGDQGRRMGSSVEGEGAGNVAVLLFGFARGASSLLRDVGRLFDPNSTGP